MKAVKMTFVWLWVALPLGWGMMKSVRKAMPLFAEKNASASSKR